MKFTGVLAVAALAAVGFGYWAFRAPNALAAAQLPSFELKRSERLTSEVHNGELTIVTIVARRSDGAEVTVTENRIVPDRPLIERTLFFPATATRILVDDMVRAKSTFHYDRSEPAYAHLLLARQDPAGRCVPGVDGGEEVVLGIPVVKLTTEGAIPFTRWVSPQLGCVDLMTRFGGAVSTPDYVRMSEPDARLFEIPSDYAELKPSARMDLRAAWVRQKFPEVPQSNTQPAESYRQSADEAYARHRRGRF